jgi:cytosine/adenosine deaminase-related metal-dependent hydrolase
MQFRKLKGDQIFDGYRLLLNKVLLVNEDGTIKGIVQETEAGTGVENFEGIISPGFINCHCHLELSHLKGLIPEKTGLVDFVVKVVNERHFPEEQVLEAIRNAEDEMIKNGIVAVGDICNNTSTIRQKLMRRLHYYNFIEVSGWLPAVAETRFERAKELLVVIKKYRLKLLVMMYMEF